MTKLGGQKKMQPLHQMQPRTGKGAGKGKMPGSMPGRGSFAGPPMGSFAGPPMQRPPMSAPMPGYGGGQRGSVSGGDFGIAGGGGPGYVAAAGPPPSGMSD